MRIAPTLVLTALVILMLSGCGNLPEVPVRTPDDQVPTDSTAAPSDQPVLTTQSTVGGLNLSGYCNATYAFGPFLPSWAVLQQNNVYGWKCKQETSVPFFYNYYSIDTNAVCRWQYGGSISSAFTNYNNPYSWYCYR